MNLYGEYGNVRMLEKCFSQAKVDIVCEEKNISDDINFNDYDIVYIGCGTESASYKALECLKKYKADIKGYIEDNKILIATGNSFELLGKLIKDDMYGDFEGLGLFDYEVERTHKKRFLGDAVFTYPYDEHKIIGFINKCSIIKGIETPLFNVEMGLGNDNLKTKEGFSYKNVFGTNLIGPVLVRNPYFCRVVLKKACDIADIDECLYINMQNQEKAYEIALSELEALINK